MTKGELLERIEALKKEVADLRAQLAAWPHPYVVPWQPWDPYRLTWYPPQITYTWGETDTTGNT